MIKKIILSWVLCWFSMSLQADLPGSPSQKPTPSRTPQRTTQPPLKKHPVIPSRKPLMKSELPPMNKPFGMPGVVGLQNGKWEGTDYLGYLSNNINISVEIINSENEQLILSPASIEDLIANIFIKENINPNAGSTQGPSLPFLHVLFLIYQVDKDKYVVFGTGRLFEQIQVMRKDFIPSGIWQGITWENQDAAIVSGEQLNAKIREVAEAIATNFIQRYRQYNFNREGFSSQLPVQP